MNISEESSQPQQQQQNIVDLTNETNTLDDTQETIDINQQQSLNHHHFVPTRSVSTEIGNDIGMDIGNPNDLLLESQGEQNIDDNVSENDDEGRKEEGRQKEQDEHRLFKLKRKYEKITNDIGDIMARLEKETRKREEQNERISLMLSEFRKELSIFYSTLKNRN